MNHIIAGLTVMSS